MQRLKLHGAGAVSSAASGLIVEVQNVAHVSAWVASSFLPQSNDKEVGLIG